MTGADLIKRIGKLALEITQDDGRLIVYHHPDSRKALRARPFQPGFPDLVIGGPVATLFREIKMEHETTAAAQWLWAARLGAAGLDIATWRPSDLESGVIRAELQAAARRPPAGRLKPPTQRVRDFSDPFWTPHP